MDLLDLHPNALLGGRHHVHAPVQATGRMVVGQRVRADRSADLGIGPRDLSAETLLNPDASVSHRLMTARMKAPPKNISEISPRVRISGTSALDDHIAPRDQSVGII